MPISADPFGLPRPINARNFFNSTNRRWLGNEVWIPEGPLQTFKEQIFDPYAHAIVSSLEARVPGIRVRSTTRPKRYVFMVKFTALDLRRFADEVPAAPIITLEQVLKTLEATHESMDSEQLLDLLSVVREDIGPRAFGKVVAEFPWVADYLR